MRTSDPNIIPFIFWDSLTLSPRLEYSGVITAHCSLNFMGLSDPPALASHVAWITGTHHHDQLIFVFLVETDRVSQCWPGWSQAPDVRSTHLSLPKCRITGVSHHAWLRRVNFYLTCHCAALILPKYYETLSTLKTIHIFIYYRISKKWL